MPYDYVGESQNFYWWKTPMFRCDDRESVNFGEVHVVDGLDAKHYKLFQRLQDGSEIEVPRGEDMKQEPLQDVIKRYTTQRNEPDLYMSAWDGEIELPRNLVVPCAERLLDMEVKKEMRRKGGARSYSQILKVALESNDEIQRLYLSGQPRKNLRYFINGRAAKQFLEELHG